MFDTYIFLIYSKAIWRISRKTRKRNNVSGDRSRQMQGFPSWGWRETVLYILHAWGRDWKALRTEVLVCSCGCGVWLCGRSEQSCHVAFPFRSHLLRGKHLFVRLPRTVTAWQPRFHQRDGQREKREMGVGSERITVFMLFFPPCPHVCWCIPFGGLSYSMPGTVWTMKIEWNQLAACDCNTSCFRPLGTALMKPDHSFLSQCYKVQVHATKSIDLSARMPSELIIKELSELGPGKGI